MINWTMLLAGALGLFLGYKLNQRANEMSEKKIIEALTAQILLLKDKVQTGRVSGDEQARIAGLEEALRIVKQK